MDKGQMILKFIEDNNKDRIREREKIDKLLPTITAGTLVISITFLTNLVSKLKLIELGYLFISWGVFNSFIAINYDCLYFCRFTFRCSWKKV